MSRFLTTKRLGILFAVLFSLSLVGVFTYQHFYVDPQERCVAEGRWWYEDGRECVTPLYLPNITGRPAGVTRADASNAKNRELIQLEDEVAQQQRALREQVAREKAQIENRRAQ